MHNVGDNEHEGIDRHEAAESEAVGRLGPRHMLADRLRWTFLVASGAGGDPQYFWGKQ